MRLVIGFLTLQPEFDRRSGGVICNGRSSSRAGFIRVLRCPLLIFIPLPAPHSLINVSQTLYTLNTDRVVKYFFISIPLITYSYGVKFFIFSLDLYTIGRTPWMSDQLVARTLPKYRTTQTQNKRARTHTKHPCPRRDSNPRSQRPNERRQFMP
jgi:hypothetical protein